MIADVNINEVTSQCTLEVRVTGLRRWNLRMHAALWCIQLACLVCPIAMHVEAEYKS